MKTILFLSVLVFSSVSMAAKAPAKAPAPSLCAAGSQQVFACTSTPQKGDEFVAGDAFDHATICVKGKKYTMVLEKNGESRSYNVKTSIRPGGSLFYVENDGLIVSLSVTTGILSKTAPARLSTDFVEAQMSISSSYTCQR